MNTLKLLAVLAIATGSVAMVFGTGAFASIDAGRLADVSVAEDDSGLLGISVEGGTVESGEEVVLFTVTNQFGSDIESMQVTVVDGGAFNNVVIQSTPEPLSSGASGEITATVAGSPSTAGTIEVRIVASSASGPSVDLTREVFVEIESAEPTLCTIENDDRIGERALDAEDELFECTIRIDADNQYEVTFETSEATGGFELSTKLLKALEFEESEIAGGTDIAISQNANGGMSFEDMDFGDDVSIAVDGVAQDIALESSTIQGKFDLSSWQQNGDVSIEESEITGGVEMEFDKPLSGSVETESTTVGGDYELTVRDNLNEDITIEESTVDGELTIVVDGNANGDITVEDVAVGGDLTVVVDGRLNGDIEISESDIDGDLTVDANPGRNVELEDNTVGGTVTRP